jgi:hypothetical protein
MPRNRWDNADERGSSLLTSLLGGVVALLIAMMVVRISCALLISIRAHALAERATLLVASHLANGAGPAERKADRLLARGLAIAPGTLDWRVEGGVVSLALRTAPAPLLGLGPLWIHASSLVN